MNQVLQSSLLRRGNSSATAHGVLQDEELRIDLARRSLRPLDDYLRAAEIFRSLGDPSRVKIVDALAQHELCTSDLSAVVGLSEPAVSQHLRLLRMLRMVTSHRHGHRVFHTLVDQHVRSLLGLTMEHLREPHAEKAEYKVE